MTMLKSTIILLIANISCINLIPLTLYSKTNTAVLVKSNPINSIPVANNPIIFTNNTNIQTKKRKMRKKIVFNPFTCFNYRNSRNYTNLNTMVVSTSKNNT